jgi:hypothetical protein
MVYRRIHSTSDMKIRASKSWKVSFGAMLGSSGWSKRSDGRRRATKPRRKAYIESLKHCEKGMMLQACIVYATGSATKVTEDVGSTT